MAKKLGLRKVSGGAAGDGIVRHISMGSEFGDEDRSRGMARVRIQHGHDVKPPKPRKGDVMTEYKPPPPTSEIHVPHSVARALSIGQRVTITLTPAGK